MSRSRRRTPITGTCVCRSERRDKEAWHRRFRRITDAAIHHEKEVMPHIRDVSNPWSFGKDGKTYWGEDRRGALWDKHPWKLWGK